MNESLYYDSVDTALMSSFFTTYMLLILALSIFMIVCEWRIYDIKQENSVTSFPR